jgi:hypothetical protein
VLYKMSPSGASVIVVYGPAPHDQASHLCTVTSPYDPGPSSVKMPFRRGGSCFYRVRLLRMLCDYPTLLNVDKPL